METSLYEVKGYDPATRLRDETLFCCANGFLGVRGCFEEGAPEGEITIRGAYINGFCEEVPIEYNERLYGFPTAKQVIVNLPDAQTVRLYANDRPVRCFDAPASDFHRALDMRLGLTRRAFRWNDGAGAICVAVERMASFAQKGLFCIRYTVTSEGFEGALRLESVLDGDVRNFSDPNDPRVAGGNAHMLTEAVCRVEDGVCAAVVSTRNSRRFAACAMTHTCDGAAQTPTIERGAMTARFACALHNGESVTLVKYCGYAEGEDEADAREKAVKIAEEACAAGDSYWRKAQASYLADFFAHARVEIQGNARLQSDLDFCLYGMLCAAGQDGKSSVAAKGLSGEGYEGHYFWDCETYIFPFFLLTAPDMARRLLVYRYEKLDAARRHARMLGHVRGALYPWRTITGSECSSYYPSGSAQYHINADVAHAFCQYWYATRDAFFLPAICEVLVETARLYLDVGHVLDGRFRIDGVTGPDEYTCMVNNNYYTNAGAAQNLLQACALCHTLDEMGGFAALSARIGVTMEELAAFAKAGESMYYPMDEALGVCKQDDSFMSKKAWPIAEIPAENFPLLIHYHPLYINRCRICKQADTVLSHYIYREETPLVMMRTYRYYEEITTHDSSLSGCVFSIMAARLGDMERAMRYFSMTVGIDREDHNGNTRDGLHIANMGGAYSAVVAGFGGVRVTADGLSLFPLLPKEWTRLRFPLAVCGSRLMVDIEHTGCRLRLLEGAPMEVRVYGKRVRVQKTDTFVSRGVAGVLFDLDGVVTDTAKYHFLAWQRIAKELGIPFTAADNERFKGVSRDACLEILLSIGKRSMSQEEKACVLRQKNECYLEALSALSPDDILPGIKEALSMLKQNGIPAALFSVSRNTDTILQRLKLEDVFDAVVTGNDITCSKPHFEGYLLAAERLAVDPRLCVMIEDAAAGIAGAQALSMRTIGIGSAENLPDADWRIVSAAALPALLKTVIEK